MKKKYIQLFFMVLLSLLFLFSCKSEPNSWTQFRGPNGSGLASKRAKPPVEFGEDKNMVWKTAILPGSSSPAIWGNNIYVTGFIEDKKELQSICIDKSNGKILWTNSIYPENFERYHAISNPAPATIAVDASGVYVYFGSYGLKCFDHNGKERWDLKMPVPENIMYGHPSSPVIMDDKLILNMDFGDNKQRRLLALNKNSGETVWETKVQEKTPFETSGFAGYSTPIRYKDQIIVHRCCGVASFNLSDGTPVWWLPILTNANSIPVIYNDMLYVGAWTQLSEKERLGEFFKYDTFEKVLNDFDANNDSLISREEIPKDLIITTRPELSDYKNDQSFTVYRFFKRFFDKDKNGLLNKQEWIESYKLWNSFLMEVGLFALPLNLTGKLNSDNIIWMQMEKNPEVPSPVAYENCIYMVKNGGWVTCMDVQTGKVFYQEKIGSPGTYIASPIAANGNIYIASHSGVVKVIKADQTPSIVSEVKLKGKILATPAIERNNLYIRTSEYLYAFAN